MYGPGALVTLAMLLAPANVAASPTGLDGIDWLERPDVSGPESLLERAIGVRVPPEDRPEPFWVGTILHDAESLTTSSLAAMGLQPRALDFAATPGILYLAMEGASLRKVCVGGGQVANAALGCTPLVTGEVDFPAYGNDQTRATTFQKLQEYYSDFNLVLTTGKPPDWVPYTLAIIGGTPDLADQEPGNCGVANTACDGAKRNHVSLTFPESQACTGSVADTAAQEAAHTWGLEHTAITSDIMYPFATGGNNSFRDECMDISHATGNGVTECTLVHKFYCPEGDGEQQNSHAEMLGVFGPRVEDTTPPTITNLVPGNGSTWTTADNFLITASFAEDSNFLAVKWDWIEGRPESLADGYSRCTNKVCNDEYLPWRDNQDPYDFIAFDHPPAGTYTMKVEAMDAYGNYVSETVTFTVIESDEPSTTGLPGETETTGDETDSDPSTQTAGPTTDATGSETTGETVDPSGSDTDSSTGSEMDEGCSCRTSGPPGSAAIVLVLAAFGVPRRRRK